MTVSQYSPVSGAPGSQGFPLDVLETKTLMWGGSTRIMEAEGTCMISARRSTNSCHFWMISEGTSLECATLDLRSCGSEVITIEPARRAGVVIVGLPEVRWSPGRARRTPLACLTGHSA